MLNEMADIFIGMLNYVITNLCGQSTEDFLNYDYFVGCIVVNISKFFVIGAFGLLYVVVIETFKTIRGVNK